MQHKPFSKTGRLNTGMFSPESTRIFLSAFYFFFCCVLGLIFSHWGVYLSEKGYSSTQVATMSALFLSANIFAPTICAYFIDITKRRTLIIRGSLCLALIFFSSLFFIETPSVSFLFYALFSACFHGVISQVEVITMFHAQARGADYSRIRVWGSIGFIVSAYAGGVLADNFGQLLIPWAVIGSIILLILSTLGLGSSDAPIGAEKADRIPLGFIFRDKRILAFFFMVAAINFSHGGYYTFFSMYLQQHDYSKTDIGRLWSAAVVSEVVMFIIFKHLAHRFSGYFLVSSCMLLTTTRWLLTAFFPSIAVLMLFAQALHAFSFAAAHSAIIDIILKIFGRGNESQCMAFYVGALVSAPAATGSIVCGYIWPHSQSAVFLTGATTVAVAYICGVLFGWQKSALPKNSA